ncbi:hydrolethalus syndrome protein 1 homolog isoform X2 [Thalassophryne amazonica]|uniref:hydrolethalus syndrome protein 1 homolog isoform X2 n=1 Tax=Thalassophryne amazonica TaxID=390379 RepID=UPI001471AC9A|nr:hydrolethalus syndrome protein 1 homolog isoform X2 [Thalassophryne amazonica]
MLDFSEEEIEEQLKLLGYKNIQKHKLCEFKRELDELIQQGKWENLIPSSQKNSTGSHTIMSPVTPPSSVKERVSPCCVQSPSDGFFLHEFEEEPNRPVLTCQNRDFGQKKGQSDSYAQHSVAAKHRLPPGAPTTLWAAPGSELSESPTSVPGLRHRRFIKRKVLRKRDGQSVVCDESVYSEESDSVSFLSERLAEIDLSASEKHDSETENEDVTSCSDRQSAELQEASLSAFESYIRSLTETRRDFRIRSKPKSFIRPALGQQKVKKSDPVAKYFYYKRLWEALKLPGEQDRSALHREIKEQLVHQPPPPKPRRVYVPNTYVVPTEKKRSSLRWEIRNDLANGVLPHKYVYRF